MSERLNIKHFTAEPEKELPERPFDPARDIPPEQWEKVWKNALNDLPETRMSFLIDVASQTKIMTGHQPHITSEDWERIQNFRADLAKGRSWDYFANRAADETILGRRPHITSEQWQGIKALRERRAEANNWIQFAWIASREAILVREPEITPEQWKKVKEERVELARIGRWDLFAELASYERILGRKLEITSEQWEGMRKHRMQPAIWSQYIERTEAQAILAADEVIIPPGGGLELKWNRSDDMKEDIPPTPQPRNF